MSTYLQKSDMAIFYELTILLFFYVTVCYSQSVYTIGTSSGICQPYEPQGICRFMNQVNNIKDKKLPFGIHLELANDANSADVDVTNALNNFANDFYGSDGMNEQCWNNVIIILCTSIFQICWDENVIADDGDNLHFYYAAPLCNNVLADMFSVCPSEALSKFSRAYPQYQPAFDTSTRSYCGCTLKAERTPNQAGMQPNYYISELYVADVCKDVIDQQTSATNRVTPIFVLVFILLISIHFMFLNIW